MISVLTPIVGEGPLLLAAIMAALSAPFLVVCAGLEMWQRYDDRVRFAEILAEVRIDEQIRRDGLMDPETGEIFDIQRMREVTE